MAAAVPGPESPAPPGHPTRHPAPLYPPIWDLMPMPGPIKLGVSRLIFPKLRGVVAIYSVACSQLLSGRELQLGSGIHAMWQPPPSSPPSWHALPM